ncbi:MAG: hypothetical protein ACLPKW_22785 [Acetobacteraceae bacterium]|jgi:hypothetical protein
MIPIAPTDKQLFSALRAWLLRVLPSSVPVRRAQVNRVVEPNAADFVMVMPLRRARLSTYVDEITDIVSLPQSLTRS